MAKAPYFYTWSAQANAQPLEMTGGEGAWFFTKDGGRWLDLGSLSYQVNVGHGNRRIVEAIKRQADTLCLASPASMFPAKTELAERLLAMAPPGFTKVFFTLGGAEANENAVKIAKQVTGRQKIISRYRSYHGATMGALTLTGDWRRVPFEPGMPGVVHVHDCYCDRCPFGQTVNACKLECASIIDETMTLEGRGTVAAVIAEPVPGANGVLVPPPGYWPRLRKACDDHGALLIADEVLTGFGRTGTGFAVEHWNVVPDMITVAKGLASGYATIGAVLVNERIANFFDDEVLACGLTYYAHPTACAAAVETLNVYRDEGMFAHAAALGPELLSSLTAIAGSLKVPARARGIGLLAALELEAPLPAWQVFGRELAARKLSLHVDGKRGTAIIAPPLCITAAELRAGLAGLSEAARLAFGARS